MTFHIIHDIDAIFCCWLFDVLPHNQVLPYDALVSTFLHSYVCKPPQLVSVFPLPESKKISMYTVNLQCQSHVHVYSKLAISPHMY